MLELSGSSESLTLDPRIETDMASAMNAADTRAWVEHTHVYQNALRQMLEIQANLKVGLPVLIINFESPQRRAGDIETSIVGMTLGVANGTRLLPGQKSHITTALPTDHYWSATTDLFGGYDGSAYLGDPARIDTAMPLVERSPDGTLRFPGYRQRTLVGDRAIEDWFVQHPRERQAFTTLCEMYYGATLEVFKPTDPRLEHTAELEIRRLEKVWQLWQRANPIPDIHDGFSDRSLTDTPPTEAEQESERVGRSIHFKLVALGARPSPLEQ